MRRLFITKTGLLGIGPHRTVGGEKIFVLHGGKTPFVLRDVTADQIAQRMRGVHGKQAGDPEKAAQAIVDAVTGAGQGKDVEGLLRLPLGKDAVQRANTKIQGFSENVEKVKHISESVVFDYDA